MATVTPVGVSTDATISRTVRALIAYQGPEARARVIAALGCSRSSFYGRLAGDTHWPAADVKVVADALGVGVGVLFDGLPWAPRGSNPQPTDYRVRLAAAA